MLAAAFIRLLITPLPLAAHLYGEDDVTVMKGGLDRVQRVW